MRLAAFATFLTIATALRAASPQLGMIDPPGGQRGSELELTITGQRLGDTKGLLFYSPGFEVESIAAEGDGKVKAKVKIASDCALGEHAVRVWTATGITDLNTINVGPFPNVAEQEPNNDAARAQKIPLNTTVNGVIKEEDIDYFAVDAKKGQRLTAEVEGIRLGLTMFDPWLAIMTKDGRLLVTDDDNALFVQDPLASVIAPEDGTYLIAVRESTWGGSDKCAYRLHVGTFPQPLAVYPAGGQIGEDLVVKLIGDASGAMEKQVKLPANAEARFPIFAEQEGIISPAANTIRVSPFPNVLENEPNNSVKQATPTDKPLPLAFNGVIGEKGDVDFFKFHAKKDEQFDVNVFARRLRSPLDSVLEIFDAQGKRLANNDDSAGPDSYQRFKFPADGDYCIAVRDQQGRGGEAFTYRVEVTPVQPQLTLAIPEIVKDTQERQAIVVPRGNRFATMLRAQRADFDGDFTVDPKDLPPGASCLAGPLAGDALPVVFEAAADAPVAGILCELAAHANDATKPVNGRYVQNIELVRGNPNNTTYYKTEVQKLAVAIADEAPFKLEVVQPKVPLLQNGAMNLRVVATRAEGFNGPINVSMLYNPPGLGSQATVTIPAGQSEIAMPLNANADAKTRAWKIALIGSGDAGKGTVWVSSQLADLEIAKPFVTGKIVRTSTDQGEPATVVCQLTQLTPFDGKAKIKLLGLPNKVTAPEMEITSADQEVQFAVATEAGSPAGQHKGLFCEISFDKEGERLVENTAQGGVLRIDRPAGKKDVAAK